jgi:DNA polymerase-1
VIAANIAKDYGALAEYELGTGDMYAGIATHAGVERSKAKTILLASLYGGGITLLAESLGVSTDEARELKASIFNAMTGVANLLKKISRIAEQHRVVFTLSGRIIPVPSMTNDEGFEKVLAYKAINYLVQGSAYDVLAETLVKIEDTGLGDAVYLAIHDELVVSTSAARDIQQIMETPPERLTWISGRLPVLRTDRADLGERWAVA